VGGRRQTGALDARTTGVAGGRQIAPVTRESGDSEQFTFPCRTAITGAVPRPHTTRDRLPSGRPATDDIQELIDSTTGDQSECELCESAKTTSVEYDIRVCRSCERELLP
jgi:hypothetical protein